MNGIMSNIQYMPSPHGVSKRIRLHHNELFSNPFQGIGPYGYPYKTKEPDDIDVFKTTHVWMRNCQFKEERNALLLGPGAGGFNGKPNESQTCVSPCLKENLIRKDLVSETYKDNLAKPLLSQPSNGTFKDAVVQSLCFLESDLKNEIEKVTMKPSLVHKGSNLPNVCEDSKCLQSEIEPKFASTTLQNGTESFLSNTELKSHFETCFKDKLAESIDEPINGIYSSNHLDISKGSCIKCQQSSEYKNDTDETKTLKINQYELDISKDSSVLSYGYETHSVNCTTNTSECSEFLESKDNKLCRIEKNSRVIDTTIKGFEEHKIDNHYIESNIDHKLIEIGNIFSDFDKGNFQGINDNFLNILNSGTKVLSWKTYAEIARRLPDYKEFSDVIQKAMKKVKHPKVDFEPISFEESTHSNTTLSAFTENFQVTEGIHENFKVTEGLHENFKVTEEIHENFKVTEGLHENFKVTEEIHENFKVTEEIHENFKVTEGLHENFKVRENLHENTITKSKQDLLLHDLDESYDFLDFASGKIQEMMLHICSTSQDIKTLEAESEAISLALYHIRNVQYIAETEGKLSIHDANAITSTRSEILKLGDHILQKIGSLELGWIAILTAYKINLVMLSRFVYNLCSIPIESKLTEQRDLVYAAIQKVDDQIIEVEVKERDLSSQRNCKLSELLELKDEINRFHRLDTFLDELCQKCFD